MFLILALPLQKNFVLRIFKMTEFHLVDQRDWWRELKSYVAFFLISFVQKIAEGALAWLYQIYVLLQLICGDPVPLMVEGNMPFNPYESNCYIFIAREKDIKPICIFLWSIGRSVSPACSKFAHKNEKT